MQQPLYDLHKSIGALLLPLVLVRLVYRLMNPPPPLPADIPAIQQFAAHATHWALYVLLIVQPWSAGSDVGLSGAGAVVRLVRTAADLAGEPRALRAAVRSAPLDAGSPSPWWPRSISARRFITISCARTASSCACSPADSRPSRHGTPASRSIGRRTDVPEVSQRLQATSILCLPIGAIEQHGPHLPLNTDVVVAGGAHAPDRCALGRRARSMAAPDRFHRALARARLGAGHALLTHP